MTFAFQSINIPPTAAQERRALENNDKTHQIVMPDEVQSLQSGPVLLTFGGDNLCLRMNSDGTAGDGSLGLYVTAMALKAMFEYSTSSPQSKIVDAELSKWTTRGWTANQKAGASYVMGIASYLKLDWLGRPAYRGSNIPLLASENAYLAATEYQSAPIGDSGD